MAIDRSGQWWTGDAPSDLDEYLAAYSAQSYRATAVVHAACVSCGDIEFTVMLDVEEGCVVRTCAACGQSREIAR